MYIPYELTYGAAGKVGEHILYREHILHREHILYREHILVGNVYIYIYIYI